ncbi:heme exporter protein CcmB [Kordiimonas pumila]|uniref:Heme exporter protein B n=1 Tax=Kordiimonas pumila TaxID=2161677 RepID=A0ABV7D371_9PROT|nr:heme exporter protein CcmB [Kordiimonas pumila]
MNQPVLTPSMFKVLTTVMARDIRLAWSQGGTGTMVLSFFLIAVCLFPFGVGPEPQILARIAPGILWVMALLACLLSLDRLFQADYEDGSLDDLVTAPTSFGTIVMAKTVAHWVSAVLPLVIASPVLGLVLHLPPEGYGVMIISLLLGTPALSFLGSVGAALTVSVRRGGVLMGLLVLPLYIPTLIFGVGAVDAAIFSGDPLPHLALLLAVSLIAVVIAPIAAAAALRLSLE